MLERLRAEPAATRLWIMRDMPYFAHWRGHAGARAALEALVATDLSIDVVRQALETLRALDAQQCVRFSMRVSRRPRSVTTRHLT